MHPAAPLQIDPSTVVIVGVVAFAVVFVGIPVLAVVVYATHRYRLGTELGLLRRRLGMSRPLGWAVGLAIVVGVFVPFVVGNPPDDGPGEVYFVLAVVLYTGGVFAAGWAVARRGHLRVIRETPTTDTGAALQPGDLVELEGEATPVDGATTAPVTGRPCLAYRYRVEDRRSSGRSATWVPIDHGRGSTHFVIDDGTGPTPVDPEGARLDVHSLAVVTVDADEEAPEPIQRLNAASDDIDPNDRLRYREWRLDPGQPVYVLGEAVRQPSADDLGRTIIAAGDGAVPFIVADQNEEALLRRLRWLVVYGGPGGAIGAVVGMGAILWLAGIV